MLAHVVKVEAHVPPLFDEHRVVCRLARVDHRRPGARKCGHRALQPLACIRPVAYVEHVAQPQRVKLQNRIECGWRRVRGAVSAHENDLIAIRNLLGCALEMARQIEIGGKGGERRKFSRRLEIRWWDDWHCCCHPLAPNALGHHQVHPENRRSLARVVSATGTREGLVRL